MGMVLVWETTPENLADLTAQTTVMCQSVEAWRLKAPMLECGSPHWELGYLVEPKLEGSRAFLVLTLTWRPSDDALL